MPLKTKRPSITSYHVDATLEFFNVAEFISLVSGAISMLLLHYITILYHYAIAVLFHVNIILAQGL